MGSGAWSPDTYNERVVARSSAGKDTFAYSNDAVKSGDLKPHQTLDPQDDLLPGLLRWALRRCSDEGFHVLEHVGCGLPKMRSFERFAPYRRKLPCWPFYYRTADPILGSQLARPEVWDPSTYDGDASYD